MGIPYDEAIRRGIVTEAQARALKLQPRAGRILPAAPTPQDALTAAVQAQWPEVVCNHRPLETRKFELDLAFPALQLGIEVDGWQYHGKHKSGFQRDREKDQLFLLAGWRVLRFTAGEIHRSVPRVLEVIAAMRTVCREAGGLRGD